MNLHEWLTHDGRGVWLIRLRSHAFACGCGGYVF